MKKVYLIQYRVADSTAFENRVKAISAWVKYFENNWIVESELSAKEIYESLSKGAEDKSILIIELNTSNYWGRMNTELWEYLKPRRK